MILTRDNIEAKKGDLVWELGCDIEGQFVPTRAIVHHPLHGVCNEDKCYVSLALCQAECDKINEANK